MKTRSFFKKISFLGGCKNLIKNTMLIKMIRIIYQKRRKGKDLFKHDFDFVIVILTIEIQPIQ
jgi:hypothetical protein